MKNKIIKFGICAFLGLSFLIVRTSKENYEIYNSLKISSDNYTRTILQVIVNQRGYEEDKIFNEIRDKYYQLEQPHCLEIFLYKNKSDLENGNNSKYKIYEKE